MISDSFSKMPNVLRNKMNDLRKHLCEEKLQRINRAWQYLTPLQQLSIFLRAWCWSLPSIIEIVEHIQRQFNTRLVYLLYPAHWIKE